MKIKWNGGTLHRRVSQVGDRVDSILGVHRSDVDGETGVVSVNDRVHDHAHQKESYRKREESRSVSD